MNLDQTNWSKNSKEGTIIDVRTGEEFYDGHLKNATLMDIGDPVLFLDAISYLNKSHVHYVYCQSGGRSATACNIMKENGIEAYNLIGGIAKWNGDIEKTK